MRFEVTLKHTRNNYTCSVSGKKRIGRNLFAWYFYGNNKKMFLCISSNISPAHKKVNYKIYQEKWEKQTLLSKYFIWIIQRFWTKKVIFFRFIQCSWPFNLFRMPWVVRRCCVVLCTQVFFSDSLYFVVYSCSVCTQSVIRWELRGTISVSRNEKIEFVREKKIQNTLQRNKNYKSKAWIITKFAQSTERTPTTKRRK